MTESNSSTLVHRLTRIAYLYNGYLAWYNVVINSLVHSSGGVKFVTLY